MVVVVVGLVEVVVCIGQLVVRNGAKIVLFQFR